MATPNSEMVLEARGRTLGGTVKRTEIGTRAVRKGSGKGGDMAKMAFSVTFHARLSTLAALEFFGLTPI